MRGNADRAGCGRDRHLSAPGHRSIQFRYGRQGDRHHRVDRGWRRLLGPSAEGGVRAMIERTLDVTTDVAAGSVGDPLSRCLVLLLKGVIYRQEQLQDWTALMRYQGRARDHLGVLG